MNICVLKRVTLSFLETPSAAAQMRLVIQKHGFGTKGGLMTGCTATLGRHGVWNAIYFGLFRTVMPIIVREQSSPYKWSIGEAPLSQPDRAAQEQGPASVSEVNRRSSGRRLPCPHGRSRFERSRGVRPGNNCDDGRTRLLPLRSRHCAVRNPEL